MQQVWEKFQRIGHEMVDLATSLSGISTAAIEKQVIFNFILIKDEICYVKNQKLLLGASLIC